MFLTRSHAILKGKKVVIERENDFLRSFGEKPDITLGKPGWEMDDQIVSEKSQDNFFVAEGTWILKCGVAHSITWDCGVLKPYLVIGLRSRLQCLEL